ncbi:MAG: hypothetical protein IRY90_08875, partial [Actinomadura rubrobrunea]|nr:hypothetical protein [Actinomadura rubrobrunea]
MPSLVEPPAGARALGVHRVLDEFPQFALDGDGPVRFVGEMIYPWFFEE